MPEQIELESASHYLMTAAWVLGTVAIAYGVGLLVSSLLQRAGRRSAVLRDVAQLTRRPVGATLMVIAATTALQRTSDARASWRGWLDHTLEIRLIASVTWVIASLVMVVERQAITRFAGGDEGLTDADRHWRTVRTQVTVLRANSLWDGRVGVLQVTDAVDGYVRIPMLVSASDAPSLFDLR